ncbi:hypothetical protein L249_2036 [Ophiocordyceps polyrhachis-furcata BCC 54312]|uniref:FAD dependent oxidoreductase domain-containing protein n=1 Tax=Ophiocordyceps polyrhachis-furcata BCC 54312 TaxID=1330021 RepID=A0A367LND8_9HYPO|nr:hypothetical protein L249_2036 [Ophiocordyceps polyrhachis-furcata BCC 54312]
MAERRHIVIVGGGIIGCTTAYYLTRHPKFDRALHCVTILEAAPAVAAGASGRAGGLLGLWAYPACLVPLSFRLHAELAAEHDGARRWGYRRLACGTVRADVTRRRLDELHHLAAPASSEPAVAAGSRPWESLPKQDAAAAAMLESADLPPELDWIDGASVIDWEEMGDEETAETAQVHPLHLTTSIAELAQRAGVELRTLAKVTDVVSSKTGGVAALHYTDRRSGETKKLEGITDVVVAAGPWTGRLLPRSKVEGLRAHSVVYESDVSPFAVFTDIRLPSDFVPEHRARRGQKRMHRGSVDPEMYARPFGEVYACGEPDSAVPLPETADEVQCDEAQCDDILSYIATISPVLGAAPVKAKQACYLPRHMRFGQESGPLLGRTTVPGLWVAAGHTCWGIQNGPATGKLMSELLFDGVATSADVEKLDPTRFKV